MDNKLKHYLIGNLPEDETAEIDLQIISGVIAEEELCLAEDNLMDDYLDEMLSLEEIELFKKNFLISEERKCEIKHLSLLKRYAQDHARNEITNKTQTLARDGFFQKLRNFLSLNLRPASALLIFVILGLAAGFFLYRSGDNEIARMNRKDLSNLAQYQHLSTVILSSESFREASETSKISAETLTDQVLLRLMLPVDMRLDGLFNVKIVKQQKEVTVLNQIPFYKNQTARELRLLIPSSLLTRGDFTIKVAPENEKNMLIVYPLAVR